MPLGSLLRCVLVLAPACLPPQDESPARRPNIVYLLADDLGWGDVGWHGSEIATPNLDALALGGARLEQFYVLPVCSPTRAALLTGRYPMRYGLQSGVIRPHEPHGLALDEQLLSSGLRQAGYSTSIVGKWHLGLATPEYLPTRRGFDHQYGHYLGSLDYFSHERDGGFDWHRDDEVNRDEGYATHLIAREAVARIEAQPEGKPLFLYVSFNAPHAPLQVPAEYTEPYAELPRKRRLYAGMTAALDEAVGQIVAALEARDLLRETLIVFSSDNGASGDRSGSNLPLRGAKDELYEGGVRVPACVYWKGRVAAGTVVDEPLHVVDWYPTLLGLAGAQVEQRLPLDGRDAWPTIALAAPSPHAELLLNTEPERGALRAGRWKLLVTATGPRSESVELYDLAADPGEQHDVSAAHSETVSSLRARYAELARGALAPLRTTQPADFVVPEVWGAHD